MPVFQIKMWKNYYPQAILFRNFLYRSSRNKGSLSLWEEDINTEIKLNIEKHWSKEVVNKPNNYSNKKSYYVLPMFPYPSGNLHMGHVRVYSISDSIARFQNLNGLNAIHPIGWDAFGLPAENAALERNIAPQTWTKSNIGSMKNQLKRLGFHFDWNRELSTCDPNYYKWTQYIFLKLFEKGLAYQNKSQVNWDPVDKTVLADEQVDDLGCSWRSGAKVEKKYLTQWFIRTTKYAKELYDGLDSNELENWKDIINLQKHWIGECNGVVVTFQMKINNEMKPFDVWTSTPCKLIHGNFLLISPKHPIIEGLKDKDYISLTCYNPISDSSIPVHITDKFNYPDGRDVSIACPILNEEDSEIAKVLDVPVSIQKSNIDIEQENHRAIEIAKRKNVGGHFVSSKLKDWLISRQRYWGTPIPIVHCNNCGPVPVPYEELPVKLPEMNSSERGIQTLDKLDDWITCKCPRCRGSAKRETDTMDTFVDSSWYYYRFLDPINQEVPFSKDAVQSHAPVDIYIGGKEHAVLHLYYARFMSYFLHSLGWNPSREPFKKLVVQGMVMGQSYKVISSGKYIPVNQVEMVGKSYKEKNSGEPVSVQWEKMSKSKYNGENPERLLEKYGCDTTRLLILADVPPGTPRQWSDATLPGVLNWQHRLWMTIREFLRHRQNVPSANTLSPEEFEKYNSKLWDSRNYLTATTTYHFKYTQKLSVGISRLQSLTSTLRNKVPPDVIAKSTEYEKALAALIIMLSPVTPHFCSELWAGFLSAPHRVCDALNLINWEADVCNQRWPAVDENYELSFLCKVDGVDRCELKVEAKNLVNLDHDKALQMMLNEEAIKRTTKRGIHKTKYELYPDCRAILHIFTKRKEKPIEVEQIVQN